ncbi:hypothetical protein lerEdw1_017743, partial [Lerista edwardsae]
GATPKRICKYHDVVEHLNLSANHDLLLYTTPTRNWEEPLEIKLDFTLISILSVNEKLQVATFYFWLNVLWRNEFVSWNPSDFCNISYITLPTKLFWMPDIHIDQRADEDKFTRSQYLTLFSNGSILVFQLYRLTAACNLDVHLFPFDEQKCNLSLMPTAQSDKEIILKSTKTSKKTSQDSRSHYLADGEWKFQKVKIIEHTDMYEEGSFSVLTYEISMKRLAIFHVLVLIVPTFTLFLLDMAISFSFASPGEIIAFKMTLILEISLLSLMLNDMLPATSDDPPVIAVFFFGIFLLLVFGILENALIAYIRGNQSFFKGRKFMSRFVKKETEESENHVVNLGQRMPKRNEGAAELSLQEKDSANNLGFLKDLSMELQEIKKHLALEGHHVAPEAVKQQDKSLLLLEKVLIYSRLLLSIIFLIYICIKWTQ